MTLESLRVNYLERVTTFINGNEPNPTLKDFIVPLAGQDYTIESNPYTSKSRIKWNITTIGNTSTSATTF